MYHKNDVFCVPDLSHARIYGIHPYLHIYQSMLIGVTEYHSSLDNSFFKRQRLENCKTLKKIAKQSTNSLLQHTASIIFSNYLC
jgi:hypothetical protein